MEANKYLDRITGKNYNYKKRYIKELLAMDNDALFEECLSEQVPDDYDGFFTDQGWFRASISKEILVDRLKESNFLL